MRKPKAGSRKPNPYANKVKVPKKPLTPPKRSAPTGPDYEGPYSRTGTSGPVNETVSKVRDILKDPFSAPIPYRKKGGATKTATKKPMMNDGGLFKKMRNNILENREKKAYSKYSQARSSGSDDTAKLYDKLLKRQTKSINAGVNVKYKKGGATKTTAKKVMVKSKKK